MGFFGDLLGGITGLFGGSKEQKVTNEVDYEKMARRATAAGFNPLTAIRNGGSAGFTTTTSPTVSQLPDALANLGGVLGGKLDEKLDPIAARRREPDTALVNAQLQGRAQSQQVPGQFYQPRTYTGTKVSQQLVPRLGARSSSQTAAVPAAFKSDMGYEQGDTPKVTNPYPKGFEPNPNAPDADTWETRLGDDFLSPAFWVTAPREIQHNFDKVVTGVTGLSGPYQWGARMRRGLVDLWTRPGDRKSGRGFPTKYRVEPRRTVPRTRVGRYAR